MYYYAHYVHYTHYVLIYFESFANMAVVSDDEFPDPLDLDDPAGSWTPPTPPEMSRFHNYCMAHLCSCLNCELIVFLIAYYMYYMYYCCYLYCISIGLVSWLYVYCWLTWSQWNLGLAVSADSKGHVDLCSIPHTVIIMPKKSSTMIFVLCTIIRIIRVMLIILSGKCPSADIVHWTCRHARPIVHWTCRHVYWDPSPTLCWYPRFVKPHAHPIFVQFDVQFIVVHIIVHNSTIILR